MTLETVEAIEVALGRLSSERAMPRRVLLGVSGGPDSLALLLAFADRPPPFDVAVATVDHGLRAEAAGEATFVAAVCRDLRLPHRILRWNAPEPPSGNLMAAARAARYRLLSDEAARIDADALVVAHHADDQIETHLLARARGGSGAALAGMRLWRDLEPGLVLLRPFLPLPKQVLAAAVERAGLPAVVDPTNTDTRYRRASLRAELANGAYDAAAVRQAIGEAEAARARQDAGVNDAILRACGEARLAVEEEGRVAFVPSGEDAALWARVIVAVGGALHPPERDAIERLSGRFAAAGRAVATLAGCRMEREGDELVLAREFGRTGPPGAPIGGRSSVWFDRRFTISSPSREGADRVEPLGRFGVGGARHRALPVVSDAKGRMMAVHPALASRFPALPPLAATQSVGWRIWADLPGEAPDRLTAQPQNAANHREAVGKDLAATYLRGRVKVRAP